MRIKTSEATPLQIDWLAAKCEGGYDLQLRSTYGTKTAWQYTMMDEEDPERMDKFYLSDTSYSTDWQLGGPIIEREKLELRPGLYHSELWACWGQTPQGERLSQQGKTGPTPLIAAMRCYVASKLGEEVDVPEELV